MEGVAESGERSVTLAHVRRLRYVPRMRHLAVSFMLLQLLFAAFVIAIVASAACSSRHRHAPVSAPRDVAPSSSLRDASVLEDSTHVDAPLDAFARCRDNLCGYDEYCSCHGPRENARCWTTREDCEVDAQCCNDRQGYCNGLRLDDCADATKKARKARDAKAATP